MDARRRRPRRPDPRDAEVTTGHFTRTQYQLSRDRVRLQNQLESLLEDAHLKLDNCVTDLLGVSSRRMLRALADGESDPSVLATLAEGNLKATAQRLAEALSAARTLNPLHHQILKLFLERLDLIENQLGTYHRQIAKALRQHQQAATRLAAVPGMGVDSDHQIIAEVSPSPAASLSPAHLASSVGECPGREESACDSKNNRSPKGNRTLARALN